MDLSTYDRYGEQLFTALDVDRNGVIDFSGPDRVTGYTTAYITKDDAIWEESTQTVYPDFNSDRAVTTAKSRRKLTNLGAFSSVSEAEGIRGNVTTSTQTVDPGTGNTFATTIVPTSIQPQVQVQRYGLPVESVSTTAVTNRYAYDGLNRLVAVTDGRGNTSTTTYNALGQVAYVEDAATNRTSYVYDQYGRRVETIDALNQSTHTAYDLRGSVVRRYGATYPVWYEYDAQGRMIAMATTRDTTLAPATVDSLENPSLDVTRWNYDPASGLLTQKLYDDGKGPSYTYTPDGKLASRIWARGVVTEYGYDALGQLVGINYSDTTPDVTYTYDRLGHQLSAIAAGVSTNLYVYSTNTLELVSEIQNGVVLTCSHDAFGRENGIVLESDYDVNYGYDVYGRFASVEYAQSTNTFEYSYLPGASLVSGMTSSTGHAWTRSYEPQRNLISAVTNRDGSTVISAFDYANDEIGRRTAISRSGTAFDTPVQDAYGYNTRSEVTSARRALASNPNQEVRGFSYDYAFDGIGNRTSSTEYDHENNARMSSYTANALNQYSQRTVPGYAGVRGSATNTATVTVNGNAAWRLGEYFFGGDEADNSLAAIMKELDVTAVVNPPGTNTPDLVQSVTGRVFVAKSPEAFTHDDDGNMLSDGRFNYTWDGENRLMAVETRSDLPASVPRVKVAYAYDHQSRRIGKVVSRRGAEAQSWDVEESRTFLYDGWNMIREIQYSNIPSFHSSTNSYVWGLDLSGTRQGAGGVGGLLAVIKDSATYLPAWDGNGNVTEYGSTDGTVVAHYEYSPFGETVIQSGDMAEAFAFRFSTKYWENEARLCYYGYRFYAPNIGRWLNNDPVGVRGGLNGYGSFKNNAIRGFDSLGLFSVDVKRIDEPDSHDPIVAGETSATWDPDFSLEPCSSPGEFKIKITQNTLKLEWWATKDGMVEKLDGTQWAAELHELTHVAIYKTHWEMFTNKVLATKPEKCVCEEEAICRQKRYLAWNYQDRALANAGNLDYDIDTYGGAPGTVAQYNNEMALYRLYVYLWAGLEECHKYF